MLTKHPSAVFATLWMSQYFAEIPPWWQRAAGGRLCLLGSPRFCHLRPAAAPHLSLDRHHQGHAARADNVTLDPCSCLALVGCQGRPPNGLPQDACPPLEHPQLIVFPSESEHKVLKSAIVTVFHEANIMLSGNQCCSYI